MQYASMYCEASRNIGDEVQSVAVERLLPRVDRRVAREGLASVTDGPVAVVLNGWFGPNRLTWPPHPSVRPVFFGFHVTNKYDSVSRIVREDLRPYYERFGPIGCRDSATRSLMEGIGVEAVTSWCATMTLDRRPERMPSAQKVFLVNADYVPVPPHLRKVGVSISQQVQATLRPSTKRAMAEDLLEMYRTEARLIITTKIHCALPCAAMGIPTVFIGDSASPRLEPVQTVLPINQYVHSSNAVVRRFTRTAANRSFIKSVDWDPDAPNFEANKETSKALFVRLLDQADN